VRRSVGPIPPSRAAAGAATVCRSSSSATRAGRRVRAGA